MEPTEKDGKGLKKVNKWAVFSGMAIQMGVIIGGMAWLGDYLDKKYQKEFPLFTLILSLFGVGVSMYIVIKEIIKMSNDEN